MSRRTGGRSISRDEGLFRITIDEEFEQLSTRSSSQMDLKMERIETAAAAIQDEKIRETQYWQR